MIHRATHPVLKCSGTRDLEAPAISIDRYSRRCSDHGRAASPHGWRIRLFDERRRCAERHDAPDRVIVELHRRRRVNPKRQHALADVTDAELRLCSSEQTRLRDAHRRLDCSPVLSFDQLRMRSAALTSQSCAPTPHDVELLLHRQILLRHWQTLHRHERMHRRKDSLLLWRKLAHLRTESQPLRPDLEPTRRRLTHERKLGALLWNQVFVCTPTDAPM